MTVLLRRFFALIVICITFTSLVANAASISKQQMDAFKRLPLAQQKALAKQYGVDISMFQGGSVATGQNDLADNAIVPPRRGDDANDDVFDFDDKFAPKTQKLERFGLDLFAGEPITFEPLNNVPVPTDYIIGPGDSFKVLLYGKVSNEYDIMVNREGLVIVPELSPISVVGMSFSEVKQAILRQVKAKMIGVQASVSMGTLRSIRIFVLGESYKPGAYSMSSLSTITHALIASGGVSDIGSLRSIQLKRAGQVVAELDLYDLLIRGDNSNDVMLRANDVVFIPAAGDLVEVSGQVRREAVFEMKAGDSYQELIKMAGGFPSTAYPNSTLIERFNGGSLRTLVNIDLSKKANLNQNPVNGDKIHVPAVSEQYEHAISLIGAVVRPGKLQWREGIKISDLIKTIHGDLLAVSDLDYALVVRHSNSKGDIEVLQFNPIRAIEEKRMSDDLVLQPRDKIVVFSRYETIEAENRMLDKYAYTEDEINDRQQGRLWDQYQQKKFMDYIGASNDEGKTKEELDKLEFENANKSLMDITSKDNMDRVNEEDFSLFSRRRLLAPIILQLKEQSTATARVQLVEVDGNVKYPGVYPLPIEGRVTTLIAAAGGIVESAFLERAEITRVNADNSSTSIEHLTSNLGAALKDVLSSQNLVLKSKDRLNVLSIPNWQENITVKLAGEVMFPGTYTISRGEVLSNVIERAGGYTKFSAPKAAVFSRASLRRKERLHLNKLSEDLKRNIAARSFQTNSSSAPVSYAETKQLLNDLSKVRAVGRLVVDLDKVMDKVTDVQLENGDVLYIPPLIQSVNVIGEVNVATAHMFDGQITVKQYIEKSGGFKQRADEDRVYIIKADGSVVIPENNDWFAVEYDIPLASGDTIVVPLDAEHMDNLTLWSSATQIIYQLGVAVAAISSL